MTIGDIRVHIAKEKIVPLSVPIGKSGLPPYGMRFADRSDRREKKGIRDMGYIDREKIDLRLPCFTDDDGNILVPLSAVRQAIAQTPAEDVSKVVHGEWIYHDCVSSYDGIISGYSCSECCSFIDEEIFDSDVFHRDFCGHCGAKMDGERKGQT